MEDFVACVAVWIGGITSLVVVLWMVGFIVPRAGEDPNVFELLALWRKSDSLARWALLIFTLFHWSLRKAYMAVALSGLSLLAIIASAICGFSPLRDILEWLLDVAKALRGQPA